MALTASAGLSMPACADMLSSLLPDNTPGYDDQDGVTVRSRLHPEQQRLGLRQGAFEVSPQLDESFGFNSNVFPGPSHRASWEVITAPSFVIGSDWSRDAVGAAVSLRNTKLLALPSQDRTDATAAVSGRLDFGQDHLNLSLTHASDHEDRGQADTLASDRPISFAADRAAASYDAQFGRWRLTPALQVTDWRYDATTILGVPASQAYRDRIETEASVTLRYQWAPLRTMLLELRGINQDYTRTPGVQPSPDSSSMQVLTGLEWNSDPVWHWRVLLGAETRGFSNALYARQNNLIADAGVTWLVSGLTSVTATISRESTEAAQEGVSGLMLSSARLTVDHEYLRNVLLQASFGVQRADYFGGGQQTGIVAGLGATWVVNRSLRLSATYDQSDLHGTSSPANGAIGNYNQGIGLITVRVGL